MSSLAEILGKRLIAISKLSVPEMGALIQHLNLLYVQMKAKEGIAEKEDNIVDFLAKKGIEQKTYFNPGQGKLKQSEIVL